MGKDLSELRVTAPIKRVILLLFIGFIGLNIDI